MTDKCLVVVSTNPRASLTCLENVGGVGGALTVIGDGCDLDLVLLTTFEHGDLAAVRAGGAV